MLYIIWLISLVMVFFVGYHFRTIDNKIEILEEEVKKKIDRPEEKPESLVVDVLDPIQEAQFELEQNQKRLNNE